MCAGFHSVGKLEAAEGSPRSLGSVLHVEVVKEAFRTQSAAFLEGKKGAEGSAHQSSNCGSTEALEAEASRVADDMVLSPTVSVVRSPSELVKQRCCFLPLSVSSQHPQYQIIPWSSPISLAEARHP